jgi:uncharacterized membrane protein YphA (DoxX/SURF4 family)
MDAERDAPWGTGKTAGFRAFTIFVLAYLLPLEPLVNLITPFIGAHVFGIEGEIAAGITGSGDTLSEYIRLLLFVVTAVVGTCVWTVLRGPRVTYVRALHWLTFAIRVFLCTMMLAYGFAKVFEGQFPPPSPARLIEPYGDSSPMGLLWTFMGHSKPYSVFTGLAEIAGGLLLLPRRTQTLGALVVVGVMSNVVMLNLCYDVPVKLFSMRLLALASFVALLDRRRLLALLVRNEATPAAPLPQLFAHPRLHLAGQVAKGIYVGILVVAAVVFQHFRIGRSSEPSAAELDGLYEVQTHVRNGVELPPLTSDPDRWQRLVLDGWVATVQGMDGALTRFETEFDDDNLVLEEIALEEDGGPLATWELSVERPTADVLVLRSTDDVGNTITLRRVDPDAFLLRRRGFHWIQEFPFNR